MRVYPVVIIVFNSNQRVQYITISAWMCRRWTVSSQESVCWLWSRRWLCWTLWSADWRAASPAGPGGRIRGPTEPHLHPASETWEQQTIPLMPAKTLSDISNVCLFVHVNILCHMLQQCFTYRSGYFLSTSILVNLKCISPRESLHTLQVSENNKTQQYMWKYGHIHKHSYTQTKGDKC